MSAGLLGTLDPFTLPVAARIAQVVLAGSVITHAGLLRPAGARADLFLVVQMVHGDLTGDLESGRLPSSDPRVEDLDRTLTTMRRLSRRAASRALLRGELGASSTPATAPGDPSHAPDAWWPAPDEPQASTLTPWQEQRLAAYLHQLDTATLVFVRAVRPWVRLVPMQAPRHVHAKQRARVLHAGSRPRRGAKRSRRAADPALLTDQAASQPVPAEPLMPEPLMPEPLMPGPFTPRPFTPEQPVAQRPVLIQDLPAAKPPIDLDSDPFPVRPPAGYVAAAEPATLSARDISAAISRAQGIDLPRGPRPSGESVELGTSGISDLLPRS